MAKNNKSFSSDQAIKIFSSLFSDVPINNSKH